MAFPTTGLVDDFNRANGALGANWANSIDGGGSGTGWKIVSNHAENDNTNLFESSYYSASTFGPNTEVYFTKLEAVAAAKQTFVWARITSPGASVNGYLVRFGSSGDSTDCGIEKLVAGVNSSIGSTFVKQVAINDIVGLEVIGTSIKAYVNAVQVGSTQTDSSHSGAGSIGMQCRDGTVSIDNFSGGSVVAAVSAALPTVPALPLIYMRKNT